MSSQITWNDKELLYGLNALLPAVEKELKGTANELDNEAKKAWRSAIGKYGRLTKGRNGREWFSLDKKKWFITNEWKVPNVIWSSRNFVKAKKLQAEKGIKTLISKKKQEALDKALEVAFSKF